ncbi:MAG: hypothetical protein RLZZ447_1531 [Verrucomicrobiota bacterium]|jgi:hypothetical protein
MKPKMICLLALWGLFEWTTASATSVLPSLTGGLTFTSTQGVYLQGTASPLTIHNATGLDFSDGDANDTPGVLTNATVAAASGDFASLLNTAAQVRDFTFATAPGSAYAVVNAGSFNFYLTSLATDVNAPWLRVFGQGYVEAAGYETTQGQFNLEVLASRTLTQVRGFNFYWEASSTVAQAAPMTLNAIVAVHDGASVLGLLSLSGAVLSGGWFVMSRRRLRG